MLDGHMAYGVPTEALRGEPALHRYGSVHNAVSGGSVGGSDRHRYGLFGRVMVPMVPRGLRDARVAAEAFAPLRQLRCARVTRDRRAPDGPRRVRGACPGAQNGQWLQ